MMRLKLFAPVILAVVLTGCAAANSPVMGIIYTGTKSPVTATGLEGATKTGEGSCIGILGLIAFGDCSIATAAKEAGIKKISSVDHSSTGILGLFGTYTVIVKGE
jgi:hypothetical protein